MTSCPPRFDLVRLSTGDLPEAEELALREHLDSCAECQRRLAALRTNLDRFEASREAHLSALRSRLAAEVAPLAPKAVRGRPRWVLRYGGAIAAAAALLLVLWLVPAGRDSGEGMRFKGGALAVEIVAKRGERQFIVTRGARLREGDALRFSVVAAEPGYLSVFGIGANAAVSSFYPETDPQKDPKPLRLARAGRHVLPGSIILDGSVGPEQLVIAFSARYYRRDRLQPQLAALLRSKGARALKEHYPALATVTVPVIKVKQP